jgi:hypothetical protein
MDAHTIVAIVNETIPLVTNALTWPSPKIKKTRPPEEMTGSN